MSELETCRVCKVAQPAAEFTRRDPRYKHQRCRTCKQKYSRAYDKNPKRRRYVRNLTLKKRYGISLETYEAMLVAQNGHCAICNQRPEKAHNYILHVDHCHKSGRVRGLLCVLCNTAIGKLRDDVSLLASAIKYLTQHA